LVTSIGLTVGIATVEISIETTVVLLENLVNSNKKKLNLKERSFINISNSYYFWYILPAAKKIFW
jgi:hypothetical protein